jgi:hypothetical protein
VTLDPKNITAQLRHRAAGNPPSTLPDSAISNCFPGLEFDFRNVWRRMFVGIELHEADNYVLSADDRRLAHLVGHRLLKVNETPTVVQLRGPTMPNAPNNVLPGSGGVATMEWSNSLAKVLRENMGGTVTGHFTEKKSPAPVGIPDTPSKMVVVDLKVRALFGEAEGNPLPVIDEGRVQPGELTMSLCSPWQNDYRECACYYWAASRPDYVNQEIDASGTSTGATWMAKSHAPTGYIPDDRVDSRLHSYEDLFKDWQGLLKFVVGGKDHD